MTIKDIFTPSALAIGCGLLTIIMADTILSVGSLQIGASIQPWFFPVAVAGGLTISALVTHRWLEPVWILLFLVWGGGN